MIVVLDASAACELLLHRPKAAAVDARLRSARQVLVPDLFVSEVANVFWKYVKAKELDLATAQTSLDLGVKLADQIIAASTLVQEALVTSAAAKHPIYDMMYIILARREGARLLSMDRKLLSIAQDLGVAGFAF